MVAKTRIFFQRRTIGLAFLIVAFVILTISAIFNSINSKKSIEIVYAQNLVSLNPYTYSDFNNSRLNYMFEALVGFSEDLKIIPKLAVSFGSVSNTHYKFRLKNNIYFHNNSHLDANLIKEILDSAKNIDSQKPLLENIQEVVVTGDYTFDIILKNPDYLLLSKLASVPIALLSQDIEANPIGTGPFILKAQTNNQLYLEPFANYHAHKAKFNQLLLTTIENQSQRLEYSQNKPHILAVFGMSPVLKESLEKTGLSLQTYIDGSTNFFLYNYTRKLSNNIDFQSRLSQAINLDMDFFEFSQGMGKDTNQLLASGVFGFNPQISTDDLFEQTDTRYYPQILLPKGFEKLSEKLSEALNKHYIYPEFSFENLYQLDSQKIVSDYDLIFFGFKSDFYDGQSLFSTFLTDSQFNFGRYKNQKAQELYDSLSQIEKPKQRQKVLQQLSSLILDSQNKLAEPLFENKVYYALNQRYQLKPRLDGFLDLTLISL